MIKLVNGRWRSVRTEVENQNQITDLYKQLKPEERAVVDELLKEYGAPSGGMPLLNTAYEVEWDKLTGPPIPVRQWVNDEYYLGETAKTLYPTLKADVVDLFEGGYTECILTGSIGWGKDYFATTCMLRVLYELLCLKNPQQSLGLGAGEPIHIVPFSHRKEAARRVVFGGVANKLNLSPFFKGRFEFTLDEIRFPDKNIFITGGSSQDAGALGLNVFCAIMDELNFMGRGKTTANSASGEQFDKAQMIYDNIRRRIKSRYQHAGVKGIVFLISSKKATDDFTERRIREAMMDKDDSRTVFVRDYATWDVKPSNYKDQKWHRCVVSPKGGRSRVLEDNEEDPQGCQVIKFPADFLVDFKRDPDGALRDVAGVATDAVNPFIVERQAVDDMMKPVRPHPFKTYEWNTEDVLRLDLDKVMTKNARGELVPICCASAQRHAHLDMSKKFDATGICVGHRGPDIEVARVDENGRKFIDTAPTFHIDLMLRVIAPKDGEIDHEAVRGLIYRLTEVGIPIRTITMDQWCFTPNAQLLRSKGFKVEEQSVVKTMQPYLSARNALYERRIESPVYEFLRKELYELEWTKEQTKVDHPRTGCFIGATRVPLLDGTMPTMEELVGKGDIWVYSARPDGVIVPGKARARMTKEVTELVDIVLDSGAIERCTPEHRWMLRDGSYKAAKDLVPGVDRLMPINRMWPVNGGYEAISDLNAVKQLTHHMVAKHTLGEIKPGLCVHHLNGNKTDNRPENLAIEPLEEHARRHTTERHAKDSTYAEKLRAGIQTFNLSPAGREKHSKALSAYMSGLSRDDYKSRARKRKAFRSDITIKDLEHVRDEIKITNANAAATALKCSRNVVIRLLKEAGFTSWSAFMAQEVGNNHKVRAVIPVTLPDPVKVYDLEVDEWHNFALCSGVFVHNSKDLSDAWAGVIYYLAENGRAGRLLPPSKGFMEPTVPTKMAQTGGAMYLGNGEFIWPDEMGPKSAQGDGDSIPSWIVI